MDLFKDFNKVKPQLIATLSASVGCMGLGYDDGWASPAIPSLKNDSSFNATERDINWITSGVPFGTTVASTFAFIFTNQFGRRGALIAISPLYIMSCLLIGLGPEPPFVIAGRIINGMVNIVNVMSSQIYASEISSPELRGALASIPPVFIITGVFLSYVFGSFLDWRRMSLVQIAFPMALMSMWLQYESPVWLLKKGQEDKAKESLRHLRGRDAAIDEEFKRIKENCDKEAAFPKFHIRELFQPLFYRPVLLCAFMMFFQMFGGYGPIVFHSVSIIEAANTSLNENAGSIILAAIMLVFSIVSSCFIDNAGRKMLLLISGAIIIVSLSALGAFFYMVDHFGQAAVSTFTWLPVAALALYYAAFATGYLTVPFILLGEMTPVRYRDTMSSVGYFANSIFIFLAVWTYPRLKNDIGEEGAYWFYAAVLLVGMFFIVIFLPETKGKSLEEIEQIFSKGRVLDVGVSENRKHAIGIGSVNDGIEMEDIIVANKLAKETA